MNFKLDANLSPDTAAAFSAAGHDARTAADEGLRHAPDNAIYAAAVGEGRVLVTADKDFANPFLHPPAETPGIVVLRPHMLAIPLIDALVRELLGYVRRQEPTGRLWVVEHGRLRIYPAD